MNNQALSRSERGFKENLRKRFLLGAKNEKTKQNN